MNHRFRQETVDDTDVSPIEVWLFAQALLGKRVSSDRVQADNAQADRELLECLAGISTRHEGQLHDLLRKEAEARAQREQLEWLAGISTRHDSELRELLRKEAETREAQARTARFIEASKLYEAQWDPTKHPRRGTPPNPGWFAPTGGARGSADMQRSPSLFDAVIQRNRAVAELTGVVTPGMIRSSRLAAELQSAVQLPGEVARAAAAGTLTGAKAVVNGFATAIKNVVTLGLSSGQLELIGVTQEDRDRGYDTAVAISTGSGQVLIAVGTGGIVSALAKGGSVARSASGALIAYDAAGNAVGVVQGVFDATQDGFKVSNGTQVAAGLLGLSANVRAAAGMTSPRAEAPSALYRVGKHADMPSPRPGQHSHHGVMSAWMKKAYPGYDPKKAPALLMPDTNHIATYNVYLTWRAEMRRKLGGVFDWNKVSETEMRALSEKMFDAAQVPASIRQQYWEEFEKMKDALRK